MTAAPVPYIASYSQERVSLRVGLARNLETTDGQRLAYLDEPIAEDWRFGVLWARQEEHRRGKPQFDQVHTGRQRQCMQDQLCQVCAGSATDPSTGRTWWVLPDAARTASPRGSKAPTCRTCISAAIAHCPTLRQRAFVYTSADVEPYGVIGHVFSPIGGKIRIQSNEVIPLDTFHRLEYTLARALIVQINDLRLEPCA